METVLSASMAYRRNLATRFFSMAKVPFSSCTLNNNHTRIKKKNYPKGEEQASSFIRRFFFQSEIPCKGGFNNNILHQNGGLEAMLSLNIPKGGEKRAVLIEETKKVLRAVQTEAVWERLKESEKTCVSYLEFVEICSEGIGFEQGMGVAKLLDESGNVIVLGNTVFLKPYQVARAIESIIPLSTQNENDPRRNELKEMESKKAKIDKKAEALVKRELWCGLGLFLLQTTGFMRLTFWELSVNN